MAESAGGGGAGGREWGFLGRGWCGWSRGSVLRAFKGGGCWSGVGDCEVGVEGRERGRGISAAEGREMVEGGGVGSGGGAVLVE